MIGKLKLLSERQSDGATEREFCDFKIVARDAEVVLLGMQLNFSAGRFESWGRPCLHFVERLIVKSLCISHLRLLGLNSRISLGNL